MAIEAMQLNKLLEGNGIQLPRASVIKTSCRHRQDFSFIWIAIDRRELLLPPPEKFCINELPNGHIEAVKTDKSYNLGLKQGQVIKALYQAYRNKRIWLRGQDLMADVGSNPEAQLRSLFSRRTEVWQALIVSDNQGCYRLNI